MYQNITIVGLDDFGRGICFINNKITFVENAMDKEVVDVEITCSKRKFNEAKVVKYKKQSPNRKNYACPYYSVCGGCHIAHFTYEKQLEFKKKKVEEILHRYTPYQDMKIHSILGSEELYYRNKVTLHVWNNKLGFYKKGTNELIEIENCLLLDPKINAVIHKINAYLKKNKLDIKEIVIRSLEEQVLLIINGKITQDFINCMGNINIVVNKKMVFNQDYIVDELLGNTFLIKRNSFYQVNKKQVARLYGLIIEFIKDRHYQNVLDLYCGTGTIGICICPYVKHVIGIEKESSSIESAKENQRLNHLSNIEFIEGKVEEKIDMIQGKIDLIIVDPSRSGLNRHAISSIKAIQPKDILYVSCDPMTLARDINLLSDSYELKKIDLVDMFMNTYHIESVCVLSKLK